MSAKSTTKAVAAKKAAPAKKAPPPEYLGGAARLIQLIVNQPRSKWTGSRAELVSVLIADAQKRQRGLEKRQRRLERRLAAAA